MADKETTTQYDIDQELVAWVVGTIEPWEEYRDTNFKDDWEAYYQQFKGVWVPSGKTRNSERSRFISPALAQAIEMAVAEMEEATFGRKYWFDVDDNIADEAKKDRQVIRDQLLEDFELASVSKAISEVYLNGAIYGTGIGKVVVEEITEIDTVQGEIVERPRIQVSLEPVSLKEFGIDPSARTVNEGLGCFHAPIKAKVDVQRKINDGIYNDVPLSNFTDDENVTAMGEKSNIISGSRVEVLEYHGLVPARLLIQIEDEIDIDLATDDDDTDMVEAIVTIANRSELLKGRVNPLHKRDRSIIAYQHDTVPNRFWGRGVAEKGMHSQRALNAELRARQDGLALTIHPMMGIDATRIPRGFKPQVAPGKTLLSNGDPAATYRPMHFGDMGTHTYREAGELERMMQMATGSMDSATPIGISPRNQTSGGMSMIASGSVKRNKRTMRNVEKDFLVPLINKASWRYQQFDPERYPAGDYKLLPFSTMGLIAREVEQGQIAQVLQGLPDGPAKGVLYKAFLDNLTMQSKTEVEDALALQFQPQPPDPVLEEMKRLQLKEQYMKTLVLEAEVGKVISETAENYANAQSKVGQTEVNKFNAISQVQTDELDREAFGRKNND